MISTLNLEDLDESNMMSKLISLSIISMKILARVQSRFKGMNYTDWKFISFLKIKLLYEGEIFSKNSSNQNYL